MDLIAHPFTGLVAVVTGGGSGIGAAVTALLRAQGARVGVLDLNPGEPASSLLPVVADVGDRASLESAMAAVAAEFGGIDILVNNAGISAVGGIDTNDDSEWHRVLDINVVGIARATAAALPYLRRSRAAAIVNLSSIAANAGLVQRALYSASKGAVHALTLSTAADLVGLGIRVNCVAPGTVDTPWVARLLARTDDPAGERARLEARQPTGRLVTADEVAGAIAYLASPASGATTGMSLAVDGGMAGLRLPARG
ncbi:NAD(P)-dependent dehydrogenase (short-subunit alcohol dehydrogenase family) [Actinoplanes lutulentus]|uniref:NADP-dependent 3-hydroxy acid dehydrogenase YdfG n=1 Tax=Actinoplanes lutulentus TaxID=1287878 RepID=A0A327YYW9_9ACTN|nr:SDR family NAD(P)-dependent oxidoreductase [Actinoplanes lutulentus]MBB2948752.1 NAD(P)-dependent dehydrogenase (short-subunit alcohol dehydrogenase family) [Actinoplanes lutulentus]RAK26178.1 NADP-dependent 3-hydroxy acid dehydrogenase YdfG [Actinoplanes lutulentus]